MSAWSSNTSMKTPRRSARLPPSRPRPREPGKERTVAAERIHRKTERTPEEKARLQAIRERFQREKPSLEDLVASGDYDGPVPQEAYLELRRVLHALRSERQRQGLSLADVAARSGIDKAALSRLETGKQI